jgi:hypothetical protein
MASTPWHMDYSLFWNFPSTDSKLPPLDPTFGNQQFLDTMDALTVDLPRPTRDPEDLPVVPAWPDFTPGGLSVAEHDSLLCLELACVICRASDPVFVSCCSPHISREPMYSTVVAGPGQLGAGDHFPWRHWYESGSEDFTSVPYVRVEMPKILTNFRGL